MMSPSFALRTRYMLNITSFPKHSRLPFGWVILILLGKISVLPQIRKLTPEFYKFKLNTS